MLRDRDAALCLPLRYLPRALPWLAALRRRRHGPSACRNIRRAPRGIACERRRACTLRSPMKSAYPSLSSAAVICICIPTARLREGHRRVAAARGVRLPLRASSIVTASSRSSPASGRAITRRRLSSTTMPPSSIRFATCRPSCAAFAGNGGRRAAHRGARAARCAAVPLATAHRRRRARVHPRRGRHGRLVARAPRSARHSHRARNPARLSRAIPRSRRRSRRTVVLVDRKIFCTPMEDGLRVGGTVEIAGLRRPAGCASRRAARAAWRATPSKDSTPPMRSRGWATAPACPTRCPSSVRPKAIPACCSPSGTAISDSPIPPILRT